MKSTPIFFVILFFLSCVTHEDFNTPNGNCDATLEPNIGFSELEDLYNGEVFQIQEELILEGFVISSDRAGNFFNVLHIQNHPTEPESGIQLQIDLRESHLLYDKGSKVHIRLKGLFLGKSDGLLQLGGTFNAFGNLAVGRLPSLKIPEHVFPQCDSKNIVPLHTTIDELSQIKPGTLVQLDGIEFVEDALEKTFAEPREETVRILKNCEDVQIELLNSGFADFQSETVQMGNGSVVGVHIKDGNSSQIVIRSLDDIQFLDTRCPEIITEFTSNQIFISELADPNNNSGARFVELFNAGLEPLDLNQWKLRRYTNDNTEVSSTIDLSGMAINAESTLVISPNASEFEVVYGFPPDLGVSTNSPADSNGDDNLELVDPFGAVIDTFGVVGEDGSGTNHEFEDGRAIRNMDITQGNPNYTFMEWTIYNDTGDSGTINQPQNAPEDFSPGIRD